MDVEARFSKDSSVRGIKFSLLESTPGAAGGTCVAKVFDEDVVKNLLEIDGVEGGGGSAPGPGEKPAMVKRLVSCFVEGVRSKKKKPQNPLADLSARKIIPGEESIRSRDRHHNDCRENDECREIIECRGTALPGERSHESIPIFLMPCRQELDLWLPNVGSVPFAPKRNITQRPRRHARGVSEGIANNASEGMMQNAPKETVHHVLDLTSLPIMFQPHAPEVASPTPLCYLHHDGKHVYTPPQGSIQLFLIVVRNFDIFSHAFLIHLVPEGMSHLIRKTMSREHNTWTKPIFVLCGSNPRQSSFPCFMSVRFNAQLGLRLNQLKCSVATSLVAVTRRNEWMNEWMNEWLNEQVQQQSTQFFVSLDKRNPCTTALTLY